MDNNWKKIWNSKKASQVKTLSEFDAFKELKRADGFDVAVENEKEYYQNFYDEWLNFYEKVNELSGNMDSVYEIGCGSGVNLYMFANRGICKLGGVDYSESLADNAREITESDDITHGDANNISTDKKYDLVMAESVFQYFTSIDYADTVLRKMIKKSEKLVYLGEVHDAEYEEELMEYRRRTIPNYDENYKGLKKQFYQREWIVRIAEEYGKKVIFTQVDNPQYLNGKYLFNCYIF